MVRRARAYLSFVKPITLVNIFQLGINFQPKPGIISARNYNKLCICIPLPGGLG
jgi:hypothetical protein